MTVYVDDAFIQASVPNGGRTVTSRWCHMTADTREELDAMALQIGLRLAWRQKTDHWSEHYDVTVPRRLAALKAGAIAIGFHEHVTSATKAAAFNRLSHTEPCAEFKRVPAAPYCATCGHPHWRDATVGA